MQFYTLKLCGLTRQLPIVALGPKLKIGSFNLLGDGELVEKVAVKLEKEIKKFDFDYLVGPEVKVVPLLQVLAKKLRKPRYIILRKNIMGYMVSPFSTSLKPALVLDGQDAQILKGKKVVIVDDVVSTGRTIRAVSELMEMVNARLVGLVAVFKQGEEEKNFGVPFIFLKRLPIFRS